MSGDIEHNILTEYYKKEDLNSLLDEFCVSSEVMDKIIVDGEGLSGGERQKIGIMRALTKKSHVIMLDEPTSSLDKASSKALVRVLRKRRKKYNNND